MTAARPKVLLVDDESLNREVVEAILTPEGYEIDEAVDGPSAVARVARAPVDLVLMDICMPGMSGLEACRRIRDELQQRTLPIVFLTCLGDRETELLATEAGGTDFLGKPVDQRQLRARVRSLLQLKALHDAKDLERADLLQKLEQTREQLHAAQRLATLGTLAAGVGHELANIATVHRSLLEVVTERSALGMGLTLEEIHDLEQVDAHLSLHAKHLLSLGERREEPRTNDLLDLRAVSAGAVALLCTAGRLKRVKLQTVYGEEPLEVHGNRIRLEQVFLNLIGNALDAIERVDGRPPKIALVLSADGGRVRCEIQDNGEGIAPENLARALDPYFTTKPLGKGTGLGLAVVRSILESFGGTLTLESVLGAGTVARFELPRVLAD